jgi:uncharacterized membrane protein YhaH (DUF805 family)
MSVKVYSKRKKYYALNLIWLRINMYNFFMIQKKLHKSATWQI